MKDWLGWIGKVLGIVGLLLLATWIFRWAAGPLTPLPDPTEAVRDSAQRVHAADSVRWAVERGALVGTVAGLERTRDSLKAARRPVRVVYVPDSRMANDTTPPDSTPMVPLADYQGLERENALADTVIGTLREIIRADSLAYTRLASLRAFEDSTHKSAYTKLAADLARARRGCRVLGLLPCPTVSAGYGVTLAGGAVHAGPVLAVTIPLKL